MSHLHAVPPATECPHCSHVAATTVCTICKREKRAPVLCANCHYFKPGTPGLLLDQCAKFARFDLIRGAKVPVYCHIERESIKAEACGAEGRHYLRKTPF